MRPPVLVRLNPGGYMKSNETCGCLTSQILAMCDSYWCLVDGPTECPYSLHFDESFTCIHPDRREFATKCSGRSSDTALPLLTH